MILILKVFTLLCLISCLSKHHLALSSSTVWFSPSLSTLSDQFKHIELILLASFLCSYVYVIKDKRDQCLFACCYSSSVISPTRNLQILKFWEDLITVGWDFCSLWMCWWLCSVFGHLQVNKLPERAITSLNREIHTISCVLNIDTMLKHSIQTIKANK